MWQLCNRTYNRCHREREYAGKPWESHSSRQYALVGVLCQDSPASPLALRWEIHPLHSLTPLDLCPGYVAAFLLFCCSSINTTSVQLEKEIQASLSLSKSTLNTNCTQVNNNHLQDKYVEASTDLSRIQRPDFNESVLSQKVHIPLFLVRSLWISVLYRTQQTFSACVLLTLWSDRNTFIFTERITTRKCSTFCTI